ncbi:MAG: tRNA pseudouridine synthase A, partial [Crocinitomicaceae bacterium]|nr:tRNA pseudouridine synthase A [Crocinitomicaceae bacterium]
FDATKRTYRYFIHKQKNPFREEQSWYNPTKLDVEKMNLAAQILLGEKDFGSFAKAHTDVKTNICTVFSAEWIKDENGLYFEISANRFLRNMVRAIVGTLIDIGMGKLNVESIHTILAAKDRQEASLSVPGHGLFLWKIDY